MTNLQETESVECNEWRQREQKILQYLDDVTSRPLVEQEKILEHILNKNADTEYLQKFARNGTTNVKNFRQLVPMSDYDSYKPYIDRICKGETSPILCADPVIEILRSSGTSNGQQKLLPSTKEDMDKRDVMYALGRPVRNRALPELAKGKPLALWFARQVDLTTGGLPCLPLTTRAIRKMVETNRPFDPTMMNVTSPMPVFVASDADEGMYCHLLLGLLQREEVFLLKSFFASMIQKALRFLKDSWQDICQDIANGTLHSRVKEDQVRMAVLPMLRKDPELAELVRSEFASEKASDGIVRRLWPNLKAIDTVCTGWMKAYLPAIATYSDNVPVITTHFSATEAIFGLNMDPLCSPENACYTAIPFSAYFEFIAVPGARKEMASESIDVVDLVSVKQGQEYELMITTVSGLYRYRTGDIFKVVGFYNSTPKFKFMRRKSTILSIDADKTDENELQLAVSQGAKLLDEGLGCKLLEYTSTADFTSDPGHYVIFWELDSSAVPKRSPTKGALEQCCTEMEANLNFNYKLGRHEDVVGPLELRLVQKGTFDHLLNYALSQGSSPSQYKTPQGIDGKQTALLELLNSNVSQTAFATGEPPFNPSLIPA